jgi:hypothetical protein
MNATAFFQQIQAGARPVIRFTQGAEDFEGYAELHMRARVVSIEERSDSVCILTVDFGEFDEHNRQFESSNYFDKSGNACLTAREAGDYKPVDTLYLPLDGDIYGFEVEDGLGVALYARYLAAKSSLSYVQWLEAELSAAPGVPREVPTAAGEGGRTHKQVLAMRKDLKMRTGKLAAQAAHASLAAVLSGHVHQESWREWHGIQFYSTPSTSVQFKPLSDHFALDEQAPGYRILQLNIFLLLIMD